MLSALLIIFLTRRAAREVKINVFTCYSPR